MAKEVYLVMKHVKQMQMGEKLKNIVAAIIGNIGKLAKKKCTINELDQPNCQNKSALVCSEYALGLLEDISGSGLLAGAANKDEVCLENAKRALKVYIKK